MPHSSEIPRRNFNKALVALGLIGASGGAAALAKKFLIERSTQTPEFITKLQKLNSYNRTFFNPPNEKLIGPAVNIAFAAYNSDPAVSLNVATQMKTLNSHLARVYIPQKFEKTTGNFDLSYLTKLTGFITQVSLQSQRINAEKEIGFDVVIDDAYDLLYSDKPSVYGSKPLSHHALKGATNRADIAKYQREFFTTKKMGDAYINRAQTILTALHPVRDKLSAIEIMNEPDINLPQKDKVNALTDWYSRVVPSIRDFYPDIPTISGVKNPYLIDSATLRDYGLDHNSAHPYGRTTFEQESITEYIQEMPSNPDLAPLLILESGVAGKAGILNIPDMIHDWYMAKSFSNLVIQNCAIDHATMQVIFPVGCFGAWQLDTGPDSHDWFQFNPDNYPYMSEAMQAVGSLLSFN